MTIGVHAAHCCMLHGCKYGDDIYGEGCPVVDGKVEQDKPCEDCSYFDEANVTKHSDEYIECSEDGC